MKEIIIFLTYLFNFYVIAAEVSDVATLHFNPCVGNPGIRIDYTPSVEYGNDNRYEMLIAGIFVPQSRVKLLFDADATLTMGFLDQFLHLNQQKVSPSCGRRQMNYKELIVNGASTQPGDWPWHVAIYRHDMSVLKYICGGTLISDKLVLTVAHCTTVQGVKVSPEILTVVVGKFNLIGGDVPTQERTVHDIIVHEKFTKNNLHNDISLLKLSIVVVFNTFVQPICMWNDDVTKSLFYSEIEGTVVGWGFNRNNTLSAQLTQTAMTILPEATCIRKKPLFYSTMLNENKFCARASNGASPCNGDSGGGLVVFVPDSPTSSTGTYFIRGIVSTTVSIPNQAICDPEYYVVFTDVAKYRTWIEDRVNDK